MNIKDGEKAVKKKIKYLKNSKKVFANISKNMRSRMINRIQSGKDHKNRDFKKYAKMTIKYYMKLGRANPTLVDMTDTGTMLRGIQYIYGNNYGEIWLGARKKIGYKHQIGLGRVPKREWFGYTKNNAQKAKKEYENHIKKSLRK